MYYYLDFESGQIPPRERSNYNDKSFEQILGDVKPEFIYIIDSFLCGIFSVKYVTITFQK